MKITDLRATVRPSMITIFPDEDATVLHVTPPTVDMVEELKEGKEALFEVLKGKPGNQKQKDAVYSLAAKFLSCNMDDIKITPDELLTKYNMSPEALKVWFADYVDFLSNLENLKN